jgi:hypothetical protein
MFFSTKAGPTQEELVNATSREVRADSTNTHVYIGVAPLSTLDSDAGWVITRSTIASPSVSMVLSDVTWDDRLTHNYGS